MFVSHQKSKLFVIVNYGWILDFEVSNGQSFRPKFSVTDFLPILRIIFVSWAALSLSLEETFSPDIGPLTHLIVCTGNKGDLCFIFLLSVCNVLLPLGCAVKF